MQAKRKLTGIMNYTNPGVVSHNEVRRAAQLGAALLGAALLVICDDRPVTLACGSLSKQLRGAVAAGGMSHV